MIYKICDKDEWEAAAMTGVYPGSANDAKDGFIHFSNAAQVPGTLARFYADADNLVLAAVDDSKLGAALIWERSGDHGLFPHLYGPLPMANVVWVKPLTRGADGVFVLPPEMGK
jgi:uncharacterized protein (DUF952 family)